MDQSCIQLGVLGPVLLFVIGHNAVHGQQVTAEDASGGKQIKLKATKCFNILYSRQCYCNNSKPSKLAKLRRPLVRYSWLAGGQMGKMGR